VKKDVCKRQILYPVNPLSHMTLSSKKTEDSITNPELIMNYSLTVKMTGTVPPQERNKLLVTLAQMYSFPLNGLSVTITSIATKTLF
jgi:hypothetical protein